MPRDPIDWAPIKNEYITNPKSTYRGLCEKYGVLLTTLSKRAKLENWKELRDETLSQVDTELRHRTTEIVIQQGVDRATKMLELSDKLVEYIDKAISELDKQQIKNKIKTKEVEYNDSRAAGKPTKEVIKEEESIVTIPGLVDKLGVQQISTALRNLASTHMAIVGDGDEIENLEEIKKQVFNND